MKQKRLKYTVFKAGQRTFVAVAKAYGGKDKAVSIANEHFKRSTNRLDVTEGNLVGNTLFIDQSGAYWVVFGKERA